MPRAWQPIPIDSKLFLNIKEACLSRGSAACENLFFTELGGQSRFPGLKTFALLTGNLPTYLWEWRNDLMAVTGGRLFRVDKNANAQDVTEVQISGGQRVVFDRTPDELVMAAGAEIIRFAGAKTEVLSIDAPLSTHAGFIDNFVVAVERHSGRFFHSSSTGFRDWDPIDTFAANGKPDDLNAMLVTPFRELLLTGLDSIEQFERLASGSAPFYRRWAVGEGVYAPYTLCYGDNAAWYVNKRREWVRSSGQTSLSAGDDVGRSLESIPEEEWVDAWAQEMTIVGQKFFILQMPHAANLYGTEGTTLLFDYRQKRWYSLYGWDDARGAPGRWPGWSYYSLWGRHFVGGDGKILELDVETFTNDGKTQRVLFRTGHVNKWGEANVTNLRAQFKRGGGSSYTVEPKVRIRAIRDNNSTTRWREKGLGLAGHRSMHVEFGGYGWANTWQFEIDMTDAAEYELVDMEVQLERGGH